jgi:hypothetical protein
MPCSLFFTRFSHAHQPLYPQRIHILNAHFGNYLSAPPVNANMVAGPAQLWEKWFIHPATDGNPTHYFIKSFMGKCLSGQYIGTLEFRPVTGCVYQTAPNGADIEPPVVPCSGCCANTEQLDFTDCKDQEVWEILYRREGIVTIRNVLYDSYLSSNGVGWVSLSSNSDTWEEWTLTPNGSHSKGPNGLAFTFSLVMAIIGLAPAPGAVPSLAYIGTGLDVYTAISVAINGATSDAAPEYLEILANIAKAFIG